MSNDIINILELLKGELEKDPDALLSNEDKVIQKIILSERQYRCVSNPTPQSIRIEFIDSIVSNYINGVEK